MTTCICICDIIFSTFFSLSCKKVVTKTVSGVLYTESNIDQLEHREQRWTDYDSQTIKEGLDFL